ncbi:hypothetical protein C0993_004595 [Termitomyces sp. T159_Od127]|nr:hypothetical protein C0993_004595 [Termitomyces sp. T159_Od127]
MGRGRSTETNWPSAPPQILAGFNPNLSTQHTCLQQRLLRDAKTMLVEVELEDPSAPQDRSPHGDHKLCMQVKVDKDMSDLMAGDESLTLSLTEPTWIRGIMALACRAYLLEFNSVDSAEQFWGYAQDPDWEVATASFGSTAKVIDKAHSLIVRFIPCKGEFDPSSPTDLTAFENKNNLPVGSVMVVTWLKKAENRSASQTLASIKMLCKTAEAANTLLHERIFIAGHQVIIWKDFKEPMHCNRCHEFGHLRAKCTPHMRAPPETAQIFMPYFPTENPATWVLNPKKSSTAPPNATLVIVHKLLAAPTPSLRYQASLLDFVHPGACAPQTPSPLE